MTYYTQTTVSKTVYTLPSEFRYKLPDPFPIETLGNIQYQYVPLSGNTDILGRAREVVASIREKDVAGRAIRLIAIIQETISIFQKARFDASCIPQLGAYQAEDGSVLFEWAFKDYRIGFNVELDPKESGWFLITNQHLGQISASGFTSGIDMRNIVTWLMSFIVMNS